MNKKENGVNECIVGRNVWWEMVRMNIGKKGGRNGDETVCWEMEEGMNWRELEEGMVGNAGVNDVNDGKWGCK